LLKNPETTFDERVEITPDLLHMPNLINS